ncbi:MULTISPECIES: glycosyltransferase [Sanguibacteroides]|uniref:Glycosyl transferase n=1 Tax=Sanguibacteroides justesenii TaxID=1547597 RepID=A0A0C3NFW0_9PORP|nr:MULTISPECIES: glycosyltransferase [Sanguibacteroides]KIO43317.1 glycosyl transferase [Sanguibacteroides justesenii]KIO45027.1 glycosyl transferase [Sanguibacteroides justesenii]PXZ42809.1 glycosyl transferase [Sanguibacteroides justesenii]
MNILIISNYFFPNNRIASFRINAFAKYFHEVGYEVTVVTEGCCDYTTFWEGCEIHYLKDPVISEQQLHQYLQSRRKWVPRRIVRALEYRLTLDDKRLWRIRAQKRVKTLFDSRKFDVVLTTYGMLSPHMIALAMRRKGYQFYWVADMRDEMSKIKWPKDRWKISRRLAGPERRILNNADLVLSVSKPILDDFRAMTIHDRFLEIRNGYDYEEVHETNFQNHFTMGYIGHFYGQITPDNWFKAYSELICEGRLPADSKIKIVGNYMKLNIPDSIKSNVEELDAVIHDEAIRISVYETDVLVMVHPKGRKGVYSGKLLDYLATNKPIIAMYDPTDVVGALMEETKAGFVVDESDIKGIKEVIMKCYRIWQNREVLPRNWDNIRQYSRRYQTRLLIDYLASR